ncbi:putative PPPDE putative peptidase domain-containing protein [Lupinus albus]|uniref:Putative PPPDE putative peptidase domain-containing protein n=1 Tax=Lupinus albus TaxID=3870 RepID=A0A6A4Q4L6_LUPAL|nr:putative PPPDE putative peptidase domain-containing protein [Lupinus albus]
MGTKSNSNSTSQSSNNKNNNANKGNNNTNNTLVVLNVYDLTPLNNYLYWFGFGIFHSGIEVHGKEYGYGAHDFPASGVFEVEPRKCPGFTYRCSINLGQVNVPRSEFRTFIEKIVSEYHGDTYHLIYKNCNHFTNDVSCRLTGKRIPGWVNRLAKIGSLCSCLLPDTLQVTTVKQLPEYHQCSEDEVTESLSSATTSPELGDEQEKYLLSPLARTDDISFVKEKETQVK